MRSKSTARHAEDAVPWRKSLTTAEATRVAEIEARVSQLISERARLSRELRLIRNRCCKRVTFIPQAERRVLLARRGA